MADRIKRQREGNMGKAECPKTKGGTMKRGGAALKNIKGKSKQNAQGS